MLRPTHHGSFADLDNGQFFRFSGDMRTGRKIGPTSYEEGGEVWDLNHPERHPVYAIAFNQADPDIARQIDTARKNTAAAQDLDPNRCPACGSTDPDCCE
jgi:hypothetical protein